MPAKTDQKSREEMSPEEREQEHVRRLHEEVDAVKSGILKRGRGKQPGTHDAGAADDTVVG
jgi:hypothetical protein